MRRRSLLILGAALICAVAAGPEPWAKLLWRAGAPGLALPLIGDPASRGAALYAAGRYPEADQVFAEVGRSATYNRGMTLTATGDYRLAVAYFEAVLFANRYDADARQNRDLVDTLVEPVVGDAVGHGRIQAILRGAGVDASDFDPDQPLQPIVAPETDPRRVKRPVDEERTLSAGEAWLDTLADAPGAYLKARLEAEMERRRSLGEAMPPEDDEW